MAFSLLSSSLYFYNNPEYNQVYCIRIILDKGVKWYIITIAYLEYKPIHPERRNHVGHNHAFHKKRGKPEQKL